MKALKFITDTIDRRILELLKRNARMTVAEIAEQVGLSPTPCGRRIKQLEDAGIIEGYTAKISEEALGLGICVFVSIKLSLQTPEGHSQFLDAIRMRPEITECMMVTGDSDYMIRLWVKDIPSLAEFIPSVLQAIPCVSETSTTLILKNIDGLNSLT
ncbi:Lrp/AsnC family transcriptional regulator [Aeromonas hydrophila]|uniref:Lrp/AsnC family transcriptional regulator n=1 Tax=Aeromonas hydrophila TaxID=644 RepID=UPI000332B87B|nr:Lrp/AsnC family transcriptional regulator [Aeromonas hydrophila]AGM44755.1 AsnC family transcriptional regulator [Aeromonas hydrophila ML09-119]ALQ62819.1 AsnC family transcriptional regulator [Aeromonas hydrophila]ALZ79519.1 AsnC family transcriptional regulator [Aeromonas hydrophila]ANR99501.1 AsnC family transcriptional regulator [Aeromonas hydrophila]AXV29428.1 AsnC family transcriptional regulator [Aeromonas hydrophila]